MNTPHLALACRWCDAVVSAPCTADEVLTVKARFELAGWCWIDGFTVCPTCSAKHRAKQEAA
jgi:hypothetical protein